MSDTREVTPTERRAFAALARRASALAKVAAITANGGPRVDPIIGRMGGQVVRTLAALVGPEVMQDLFGFVTKQMRDAHGICVCGRGKEPATAVLCRSCLSEMEQVDKELEQSELLDRADEGRPQ